MRVAVVGAGVIGVTSALAVKTAFPNYDVKIFADAFSPDTTGDGSAGLWGPYLLTDTPAEDIIRWAGRTHRWFEQLWQAGLSSKTGVSLIPVTRVASNNECNANPAWAKLVYGIQQISSEQLRRLNEEHKSNYKIGWHFLTYTAEPVLLLPWLMRRFIIMGGEVEKRSVKALYELVEEDGYDLIINCSGLGARELVADKTVTPIRGQVCKVKASWAMRCFLVDDDDANYIIPNIDCVVLGGTHQEDDFDRSVREVDSKHIYEGCCRMMPSLKASDVVCSWVGLRPGRPRVRLECETLCSRGKEFKVIHNYGHGGSGVTLCWGCAADVVDMIRNLKVSGLNSKL